MVEVFLPRKLGAEKFAFVLRPGVGTCTGKYRDAQISNCRAIRNRVCKVLNFSDLIRGAELRGEDTILPSTRSSDGLQESVPGLCIDGARTRWGSCEAFLKRHCWSEGDEQNIR